MTQKRTDHRGKAIEIDVPELLRIRAQTLDALRALDGVAWAAASGELHLQHNEMPNWVTLRDDDNLAAAHRVFAAVFASHFAAMGRINATVAYSRGRAQLAFLETNDEIEAAARDGLRAT
jgi:hypothetical protein